MSSKTSGKRVLVTGGAGFIGSHLVDRLLRDGHHVIVIDNCSTGRWANLAHAKDNPSLVQHEFDISDFEKIRALFEGIDWVFHIAALADIVPSIQTPLTYHRANVDGTVSCLEASRLAGVKRFIYAASSSCYGIPDAYPTSETAEIRPMYPYALTKYIGELSTMHWNRTYGLPALSFRFFNVYGPRSRTSGTYGAVFGVFLAQKLAGKAFTVVGDGEQTRDFIFVTDIVDALVRGAESTLSGECFNVGTSTPVSINRVVELLGGTPTYIPKRPGEPDCTCADTTKIRGELGWKPSVTFEQGVERMLSNIDYWRDAPVWTTASIADATRDWHRYMKDA